MSAQHNAPIPLVPWPDGRTDRSALRSRGGPSILLVAPGAAPPDDCTLLEDWIRAPVDQSELTRRRATLAGRRKDVLKQVSAHAMPPTMVAVLDLLVSQTCHPVTRRDARDAYRRAGGAATSAAFDAALVRLRRRLGDTATIHTLGGGELMLEM